MKIERIIEAKLITLNLPVPEVILDRLINGEDYQLNKVVSKDTKGYHILEKSSCGIPVPTNTLGAYGHCISRMEMDITISLHKKAKDFYGASIRLDYKYEHIGGGSNGTRVSYVINKDRNQEYDLPMYHWEVKGH